MARKHASNVQQIQRVPYRPGEGYVIGTVRQNMPGPNGEGSLNLMLRLDTAQVPERRYVANAATAVYEGERVTIVFGQKKLGGMGYRSLLLLEMSTTYAHQLIRASSELVTLVDKYLTEQNAPRTEVSDIDEDVPGQTITLAANIATAGHTGRDACMDFYYASPFSVQIAAQGGDFAAEPVVRVTLPTSLMLALHQKLQSLKDSMPAEKLGDIK